MAAGPGKWKVGEDLKALITGITGQDGSYLAEHLLSLGNEVHGLVRRVALEDPERRFTRINHFLDRIQLHAASLESYPSLFAVVSRHDFDECYHLAAQSFVAESFADGFSTMNTNINGTHYMLAALRELQPKCHFYFAGSSEMFGKVRQTPQNEETPFHPRSPYGISKVAGFELTRNYPEAYGMFAASGILFNHEGPRRGFEFVTRKITSTVARTKAGQVTELPLGNLDARRDWGHSKDYVRAMYLMLQHLRLTILWWRPASHTRCANFANWRSRRWASTIATTYALMSASTVVLKLNPWWVTRRRRVRSSAGHPPALSLKLSTRWCKTISG